MARAVASKKQHLKLFEAHEKYGELVRVGPKLLLTADPDLLQRMSSARSAYTKSDWYSGQKLEVDQDNLISTLDEKIRKSNGVEAICPFRKILKAEAS